MRKRATSELLIYRPTLSRRSMIAGLPLLVAACADSGRFSQFPGAVQDGAFKFPEIGPTPIDPSLLRQEVSWRGRERPGSIVVIVPERRLYLVQGNGRDGGRANLWELEGAILNSAAKLVKAPRIRTSSHQ